jgi:hypothetical protein
MRVASTTGLQRAMSASLRARASAGGQGDTGLVPITSRPQARI